jgi:hypothetical protein
MASVASITEQAGQRIERIDLPTMEGLVPTVLDALKNS